MLAVVAWSFAHRDPDTISLDLRTPLAESSLPGRPMVGFPMVHDYDSGQVRLRLPDGLAVDRPVDGVSVWSKDGLVRSVDYRLRADSPVAARKVAAAWAGELGVPVAGLQERPYRDWTSAAWTAHLQLDISIDDLSIGTALVFAHVRLLGR